MQVSQVDAATLLFPNPYTLLPLIVVWKQVTFSFTYMHTWMVYMHTYQEKQNYKTPKKGFLFPKYGHSFIDSYISINTHRENIVIVDRKLVEGALEGVSYYLGASHITTDKCIQTFYYIDFCLS